jgi:23S rRNA (uracil1939-C5)-methyltransferase
VNSGAEPERVTVESLTHDGRGLARLLGKAVFVPGALPGEEVLIRRRRRRGRFDEAELVEVIARSPERVAPRCAHYGTCGGCCLQHASPELQRRAKEAALLDELERSARVRPDSVLPALSSEPWGYRRRARLGAKYVTNKGRVLVGFRERASPFVTDSERCEVLAPEVGPLLGALAELIGSLTIRDRVPQIEVAVAEGAAALCLRVLAEPSASDRSKLAAFGAEHGLDMWLQTGGTETAQPLTTARPLTYRLPDFDLALEFGPLDFVQINAALNRRVVALAMECLAPVPTDSVLDLYCGLGNFTLPIARRSARVVGVEGAAGLIALARANARANGIGNAEFAVGDLDQECRELPWAREHYDRVLLDPPRVGAKAVLPLIAAGGATRVVYISCHPGSLARDAGSLVHEHGYHLVQAGIMDMFPHTAHVESIAVFERR